MMSYTFGSQRMGSVLERSPSYQAAVRAQQAKERERLEGSKVLTFQPQKAQKTNIADRCELDRLNLWLEYHSERPSTDCIIKWNAIKYGVTVADLKGNSRIHTIVEARHRTVADIHRKRPDMSLPAIGQAMGGKDHTTVLNSLNKCGIASAKKEYSFDPEKVRQKYVDGMTISEIADEMRVPEGKVYQATKDIRISVYDRTHMRILKYSHLPIKEIMSKTGYAINTVREHIRAANRATKQAA